MTTMLKFISDSAHYAEVLARVPKVKRSLWIGTADVSHLAIEDQDLEMYPRTECPFKTIEQSRVFVEVFAEGRAWFLGMDEPYFDSFFDKLRQDSKERLHLRTDFDIKVFDVGGTYP